MNVVVLDDYQDAVRKLDCLDLLQGLNTKVYTNTVKGIGQLSLRLRDADVVVLIRDRSEIQRTLLDKLPKLKLIAQVGRAGSHVDVNACSERGVAVTQSLGDFVAPAEFTWALIMSAMRRIPQYVSNLKHGAWQQSGLKSAAMPPNFGLGMGLRGKTLGLWGYGKVGQLVAQYAKAFQMHVLVWDLPEPLAKAQQDGFEAAGSKAQLFESADVLSLHLRLTQDTQGAVTAEDFALMKPSALFVNTAKAELMQPNALLTALNRGRPGMAAVDNFETEPILQGHALLRLENCICTPHISYVEQSSYEQSFRAAFENIAGFVAGRPSNIINPGALQLRRR